MNPRIAALRQSLLFSGLHEADIERLATICSPRKVRAGEAVFLEGAPGKWFYLVIRGRIKAVKHSSQGKEFIVSFFGPGEMFGEVAAFEGRSYPATAVAADDTTVLAIPRDDFLDLLRVNPELALRMISLLGNRLRDAQTRLKDLAGERVDQRIARLLLMLSSRMGPNLPFTRQEIADMAGATMETAIRVIGRLRDGGVLETERGLLTITDQDKLRALAEGPPSP